MGRLVASVKRLSPARFRERYEADFMTALSRRATPGPGAGPPRLLAPRPMRADPELGDAVENLYPQASHLVIEEILARPEHEGRIAK